MELFFTLPGLSLLSAPLLLHPARLPRVNKSWSGDRGRTVIENVDSSD